jgi:hypothetical protein
MNTIEWSHSNSSLALALRLPGMQWDTSQME